MIFSLKSDDLGYGCEPFSKCRSFNLIDLLVLDATRVFKASNSSTIVVYVSLSCLVKDSSMKLNSCSCPMKICRFCNADETMIMILCSFILFKLLELEIIHYILKSMINPSLMMINGRTKCNEIIVANKSHLKFKNIQKKISMNFYTHTVKSPNIDRAPNFDRFHRK